MTRAFVLTGGGNLGAVQVGMLSALHSLGIAPDLLVGTSVGALNAAYVAGRGLTQESVDDLTDVWLAVRRRDVFALDPFRSLLALAGARPSLCSPAGLRRVIEGALTYLNLEDALVPVHVTATDVLTGREVGLGRGDVVEAVLASASVPGVFPPVQIEGAALYDGVVADRAGVSRAVGLGADEIWVLPTGYACALEKQPRGALAVALHAVSLLAHGQLVREVEYFADRIDLHVLPPLCPVSVSPLDFSDTGELIARGRRDTLAWLASRPAVAPEPTSVLALHDHFTQTTVGARGRQRRRSGGHQLGRNMN